MRAFLIAVQFLTTLPVTLKRPPTEVESGRSLTFYPLVGLLLGTMLAGGGWILRQENPLLVSALLLAVWTALTGALHLDGLADCADAWVGGRGDRARTLAIMKDVCSGPMGVTSIVIVLLMKFAGIAVLCEQHAILQLAIVPLLARTAIQLLFLTTPYVRADGLGAAMAANLRRGNILVAVVLTVFGVLAFTQCAGLWAVSAAASVFILCQHSMLARIGGTTGDTAGALAEIAEACTLLALCFATHGA
ncbi:MAG: adenosylcobinamide-GDP ribazoletransferase [Alphaproteobacteria bacterium]|nr:adenosylcobinamide-GDP ribazoletransferase [Alphaproteobacteria bacterium]MDE2494648.1 adenosylcobinamide-GDP ribazoletransferase [Alphaproteobacteria bacterium]